MSYAKNIPASGKLETTSKRSYEWLNPKHQFELRDNQVVEYKSIVVYRFFVPGDDPVVEAAEHLWKWEQSEAGQWVMQHAVEQPIWHKTEDFASYSMMIIIVAKLEAKDVTFWQLKWGS